MRTAAGLVGGWAAMLLGAYALTVASLPGRANGSFMVFVIAVYYVIPAIVAVLLIGLLAAAALHRTIGSDLWRGVVASWIGTLVVLAAGLTLL